MITENQTFKNSPQRPWYQKPGWWLLLFFILIIGFIGSFLFSPIQTFWAQKAASYFSQEWGTEISLKNIDIRLNGRVRVHGLLVRDRGGDTLLFAENFQARIPNWMTLAKKPQLNQVSLNRALIRVKELDSLGHHNFDFLVDILATPKTKPAKTSAPFLLQHFRGKQIQVEYHRFKGNQTGPLSKQKTIILTDASWYISKLSAGKNIDLQLNQFRGNINQSEKIKFLAADLTITSKKIDVDHFIFRSNSGTIKGKVSVKNYPKNPSISAQMDSIYMRKSGIQRWVNSPTPFDKNGFIRGSFQYATDHLVAQRLTIQLDGKTIIAGNFQVNHWDQPNKLEASAQHASIHLNPAQLAHKMNLVIPEELASLGHVSFEGNGQYANKTIETEGLLVSDLGSLSTDARFSWRNGYEIEGDVTTTELNLSPFLPQGTQLSNINFQGNMNISGKNIEQLQGSVEGSLEKIKYNGKNFDRIGIHGTFEPGFFHGSLQAQDEGLNLTLNGDIALDPAKNYSKVALQIRKIDLQKLGITQDHSWVNGNFEFNGKGEDVESFLGYLNGNNLSLHTSKEVFELPELNIYSQNDQGTKMVGLQSSWGSMNVSGDFQTLEIWKWANNMAAPHLPAYLTPFPHLKPASFDWKIQVREPEKITHLVGIDDLKLTPFQGNGILRSNTGRSLSRIILNDVQYQDSRINGGLFVVNTDTNRMSVSLQTEAVTLNDTALINHFNFNAFVHQDTINFTNDIIRDLGRNEGNLAGIWVVYPDSNVLSIDQSTLKVNGDLWRFYQSKPIVFDRTGITLNQLGVKSMEQLVQISGKVSDSPLDTVYFVTKEFNLAQLNNFLKAFQVHVEGTSDISVSASNYLKDPFLKGEVNIKSLLVDTVRYGDVRVNAEWMRLEKTIRVDGQVYNPNTHSKLDVKGFVDFHENHEEIDVTATLNRTDARWLEKLLAPDLHHIQGFADGFIQVYGTFDKPLLIGAVNLDSASFIIDAMNVRYNTGKKPISILFTDESIDFNKIYLYDDFGGLAVLNGKVLHNYLRNTRLDLKLEIPEKTKTNPNNKVLVYDFPNYTNGDMFYGTAFATGVATIKGHISLIDFNIIAKSKEGTLFKIPLEETEYSSTADFMQFMVRDTSINVKRKDRKIELEGINFNLELEATPEAEVHLIFDELAGDVIRGRGKGNLKMAYDKEGDFTLFGNYQISKGDYHFTWENVIDKKFDLVPGGTLVWSGDPYHAQMDLQAIYTQRTTLSNLINQDYDQSRLGDTTRNIKNIRYPVQTVLKMSGDLMKPDIGFEIKIPNLSPGDLAAIKLKDINNNQQELNNQVFGLLMLGQFINNSNLALDVSGSFNTLGEMVSNQLSNLVSKYAKNLNIGLNYFGQSSSSSTGSSRKQVQLAMNTTLFNDRVILDGNLDFGSDFLKSQTSGQSIGGTFSIEYLIDEEGKFRVKAFNKLEDNLLVANAGSNYRQGLGVSYMKEFNSFNDLLASTKELLRQQRLKKNPIKTSNSIQIENKATVIQ